MLQARPCRHLLSLKGAILALVAATSFTTIAAAQPAERTTPPAVPFPPSPSPETAAPAPPSEPLVPAAPVRAAPPAPVAPPPTRDDDIAALRAEVQALRTEVESRRTQEPPAAASPSPWRETARKPLGYEEFWPWVLPPEGLSVPAYIQAQYETHQDSQDQLSANGTTLNKDRFSIRRARVGLTGEWEYAAFALQLDANTTNGPQVDLRKAEASVQYRPDRSRPPLIMATIGLFDIPFGFENVEAAHTRFFMEPSVASQAFFPGQADLGARLAGALGFFRWTLAIMNGQPLGEASSFVLQDPDSGKDLMARFGFDTQPRSNWQIAGGVSGLNGEGFHPGTLASGSSLQWQDTNGTGAVEASELVGVPAQSGTPSSTFNRWAIGADLRTSIRWWPGIAKIYGEIILAQNLDRGLYVADPVLTGLNQQELGFYVAAQQEITRWGIVGLRFDYYNPNANVFDKRGGALIPYSEAIETVSPLIGLVLPDRARFLVQYDIIHNAYARNSVGVPTSLADNVLTLRLQVQL
jgi:Phosphate-selective porin O and P